MVELHTAERWQRDGRAVRPAELLSPARTIARNLLPAAGCGDALVRLWCMLLHKALRLLHFPHQLCAYQEQLLKLVWD